MSIPEMIISNGGFVTANEVVGRNEYERLRKATKDGSVVRLKNGIYAEMSALASNIIDIERIVPNGVVCLYSAFMHHGLSTQVQAAVCVAIEAKRKVILPEFPPIALYYWKKENLDFGVAETEIGGFKMRITDLERTVCDAVKYRNKIGLDVCGEIIDNYVKRPDKNISRLHLYAKALRVEKVMNVYIETRL